MAASARSGSSPLSRQPAQPLLDGRTGDEIVSRSSVTINHNVATSLAARHKPSGEAERHHGFSREYRVSGKR